MYKTIHSRAWQPLRQDVIDFRWRLVVFNHLQFQAWMWRPASPQLSHLRARLKRHLSLKDCLPLDPAQRTGGHGFK
jgi:hypothetical protein